METALTPAETTEFRDTVTEFSGLVITDAAITELLTPALVGEIREFGIGDTETNSAIASAFSRALLNRDWPIKKDITEGLNFDSFIADLHTTCAARGWLAVAGEATDLDR